MTLKVGWLTNPFQGDPEEPAPVLSEEVRARFRNWRWQKQFTLLLNYPTGPFGVEDLRKVSGSRAHDAAWCYDMVDNWYVTGVLVEDSYVVLEKGHIVDMNVNIVDQASIPTTLARITPGMYADGGGLNAFLRNWAEMYQQYSNLEWNRTGKEKSLAARVYAKCHSNADEATKLAYAFFHQPTETMPDDVNFTSFYMTVDKLVASFAQDRQFEADKRAGERDAARRLIIDPTEEERITAENRAIIERNRQQREEEERTRQTDDEETVPVRESNSRSPRGDD